MTLTTQYFEKIFPEVNLISKKSLRKKVLETWVAATVQGGWKKIDHIPFTLYYPTPISLLTHVRQVTQMAIYVAERWEETDPGMLDTDTLIAGALLHDVGKLLEYQETVNGITFKPGALRHHFSGVQIAGEQGLPDDVLNCIAYHGSEVNPKRRIPESIVIHHCDFICFELEQKRET
ncbi:MAG: HD domain-containing protein [Candidatus Ranarchaeia archaeon]